jgi:NitT/TauT family transport system ATP-binding protein
MYTVLQELWMELNQTIVLVTHDLHEAIFLGGRILVATPLPFKIRCLLDVPFQYPRTDSVTNSEKYLQITQSLRIALRLENDEKRKLREPQ